MKITSNQIERRKTINLQTVMLDGNVNWQEHIPTVENQIAKNVGSTVQSIKTK